MTTATGAAIVGASDPQLDALVAEARRPRTEAFGADVPKLERNGKPMQGWFPQIVRKATREVERMGDREPVLLRARIRSRWVLGPGEEPGAYEVLARRQAVAELVHRRMRLRPAACASAVVRGDGFQPIADGRTGGVLAAVHSGLITATVVTCRRALGGRPLFIPGDPSDVEFMSYMERIGLRSVQPRRRFEVLRQLLREDEVCFVPADALGVKSSTLLDRPVRTTRMPAALAKSAGVPLVLCGSFWDADGFEVRTSAMDPSDYPSIDAMHAALMTTFDGWLREHPEQLIIRFPAAELARMRARRAVAGAAMERAAEEARAAAVSRRSAKRRLTQLQADGASDEDLALARSHLAAARKAYADAQAQQERCRLALRAALAELKTGPRPGPTTGA